MEKIWKKYGKNMEKENMEKENMKKEISKIGTGISKIAIGEIEIGKIEIGSTSTENSFGIEDFSSKVLTVREFSVHLKSILEEKFPYIWIKGEVGQIKIHSSGHTYFSLKEDDFIINAICWKGTTTSSKLEEGAIVECYGKITIYPGRSSYQIIAKEVKQVNQQGNIFLQLEELKKKLTQEGVFSLEHKKPINQMPNSIAILTSPTGAVLHDILHRIANRFPCCEVYFLPIGVQNSQSEQSIIAALEKADKLNVDTIILARGGGSLEDLWVFNSENIVRTIFKLQTPIISAIGHETDTTLCDYVADLRAPTPTGAAELAVPNRFDLIDKLNKMYKNAMLYFGEKIKQSKLVKESFKDIDYTYRSAIFAIDQKIDNYILVFNNKVINRLSDLKTILGQQVDDQSIAKHLSGIIDQKYEAVMAIAKFRLKEAKTAICEQKIFLEEMKEDFRRKVIIKSGDKMIVTAEDLSKEREFVVQFVDGSVEAVTKNLL